MLKVLHSTPTISTTNRRQTKKGSRIVFESFVEDETMAIR